MITLVSLYTLTHSLSRVRTRTHTHTQQHILLTISHSYHSLYIVHMYNVHIYNLHKYISKPHPLALYSCQSSSGTHTHTHAILYDYCCTTYRLYYETKPHSLIYLGPQYFTCLPVSFQFTLYLHTRIYIYTHTL